MELHMAKKTTSTDTDAPEVSQLSTEITTALATSDATAVQRIQELQLVHQARVSQLTRTVAVLKAQHGANDPGVKAAEANVAAATQTAARVGVVYQQQTTPVPQVANNGWALHGRVFNPQLGPVSGFTVFLVDGQKTYQEAYGFAYTDDTGYFLLNYAGAESSTPTPTEDAAAPQLFLEITDTKAKPVFLSATPFQPAVGSATYQNITLTAADHPIGDPPQPSEKSPCPSKGGRRRSRDSGCAIRLTKVGREIFE
jgi:hypothetical protein